VLDERIYYVHNWRNDVVALVTDTGAQVESVRYSAYGIPFGSYAGDADNDGDVNASSSTDDTDQIQTWINTSTYDIRGDLDLDGDVDAADKTAALANAGTITGWKDLTSNAVGNFKGYAGYEFDDTVQRHWSTWHVRHRVLVSNLGCWSQRDPKGFIDGPSLYSYATTQPVIHLDPTGTHCSGGCTTYSLSACSVLWHNLLTLPSCASFDCLGQMLVDACDQLSKQVYLDPCTFGDPTCVCTNKMYVGTIDIQINQFITVKKNCATIYAPPCNVTALFVLTGKLDLHFGVCQTRKGPGRPSAPRGVPIEHPDAPNDLEDLIPGLPVEANDWDDWH
jgi:RHS repeat-associated protein